MESFQRFSTVFVDICEGKICRSDCGLNSKFLSRNFGVQRGFSRDLGHARVLCGGHWFASTVSRLEAGVAYLINIETKEL